jgi:hypothetical protein
MHFHKGVNRGNKAKEPIFVIQELHADFPLVKKELNHKEMQAKLDI